MRIGQNALLAFLVCGALGVGCRTRTAPPAEPLGLGGEVFEPVNTGVAPSPPGRTPAVPSAPKPAAAKPPATKPAPAPEPTGTLAHAAQGCQILASSTSRGATGEGTPDALVDGDLATRWSSAYTAPQQVTLLFAKPMRIERLKLYWEHASARRYAVSVTADGRNWTGVHVYMNLSAKAERRVDDINLKGVLASGVRLDLLERVNPEWGFSLHEIAVLAAP